MLKKKDLIFLMDEDLLLAYLKHKKKMRERILSDSLSSTFINKKERTVVRKTPDIYIKESVSVLKSRPKCDFENLQNKLQRTSTESSKKLETLPVMISSTMPDVSGMVQPTQVRSELSLENRENQIPLESLEYNFQKGKLELPPSPSRFLKETSIPEAERLSMTSTSEPIIQLPPIPPSRAGDILPPLSNVSEPSTSSITPLPMLPPSPSIFNKSKLLVIPEPFSNQSVTSNNSNNSIDLNTAVRTDINTTAQSNTSPASPISVSRRTLPPLSQLTILK